MPFADVACALKTQTAINSGADAPFPSSPSQALTRQLRVAAPSILTLSASLRSAALPKGEPIAAHGQRLLNLGDALAPPLGELASVARLRG